MIILKKCLKTLSLLLILSFNLANCIDDDDLKAQYEPESNDDEDVIIIKHNPRELAHNGQTLLGASSDLIEPTLYNFELPETIDTRSAEMQLFGPQPRPQTYGVIVDCGSSGTRAHLYHWDTEIDFSLKMLHDIEPVRGGNNNGKPLTLKVTPGLATFAEKSRQERVEYIKPLIDFIACSIPKSRHKFTGIFFLATAGMRLIDEHDRNSIMRDIKEFVEQNYKFAKGMPKMAVISGAEEGMYQWISINAKGTRFLANNTGPRTKTYAVIEMGGASLQVTYQLRSGLAELVVQSLPAKLRPIYWSQLIEPVISREDILGANYKLHSTTFLGLGANNAREAYLDLLIYEQRKWNSITSFTRKLFSPKGKNTSEIEYTLDGKKIYIFEDPCLPKGYESGEKEKPMRFLKRSKYMRKIGYTAVEYEPMFSYKLRGISKYDKCRKLVEKMLEIAKEEKMFCPIGEEANCTMSLLGEQFVPFTRFDFVAIGGFYYAIANKMLGGHENYNQRRFNRRLRLLCSMPHGQMLHRYGKEKSDGTGKELEVTQLNSCFLATWAETFLRKGLKMPEDFEMLEVKKEINNKELDWTLGAILDKSIAIEEATENL